MPNSALKVSIIMPCFNASEHLLSSVDSVLNQSFNGYELILVNDASTDNTSEIIEQLVQQHKFIRSVNLKKNVGAGKARNAGITVANTSLIALLDADDQWHKDKLAIQFKLHQQTQCAFSCTGFSFGNTYVLDKQADYTSLLKNNVINTSSIMFDIKQIDIKFTSSDTSSDYIAWLDVAKQTDIQFINKVLVERTIFNGISSNKLTMAKKRWNIYRNIEKIGFFSSIKYMFFYATSGLMKYLKK